MVKEKERWEFLVFTWHNMLKFNRVFRLALPLNRHLIFLIISVTNIKESFPTSDLLRNQVVVFIMLSNLRLSAIFFYTEKQLRVL